MQGIFNTITINGGEVLRPNDFTLERENIVAAEYMTYDGKRHADLIGWRYADLTLQFDTLPQDQLLGLFGSMGGTVNMTFTDEEGNSVTELVSINSSGAAATRFTGEDGNVMWKNVAFKVQFMDSHTYD